MLEISHRSGSYANPLLGPRLVSASCQTDDIITSTQLELTRDLDELEEEEDEDHSAFNPLLAVSPTSAASISTASPTYSTSPRGSSAASSVIMNGAIQDIGDTNDGNGSTGDADSASGTSPQRPLSSASEEESEDTSSFSEDDEISFNTIKRQVPAHAISKEVNTR